MQIAIDKDGKRAHAYNAKNGDDYLCPICGGRMKWPKSGMLAFRKG